ncbi:WGxxGxxG family protein [Paenibacillus sp. OSY-SE]|uniref:WGxxGxxG family protein n=1 Tax=Paenibacillus sp. OSY-SE TaxID=1196323 RepID=UPI00037B3F1E|nr:WGxxGxxG family protein [Paenibacillus sp. OSY-SE]
MKKRLSAILIMASISMVLAVPAFAVDGSSYDGGMNTNATNGYNTNTTGNYNTSNVRTNAVNGNRGNNYGWLGLLGLIGLAGLRKRNDEYSGQRS